MIPPQVSEKLQALLSTHCGKEIDILSSSAIGGGCINNAMRIESNAGPFFLKWNDSKKHPEMFGREAKGLALLKTADAIGIPNVIGADEAGSYSFIVLEFIEAGK